MANTSNNDWTVDSPTDQEYIANAAAELRFLRGGVGDRLTKEHIAPAGSGVGGDHKKGSARCYVQAIAPATRMNGATAFTSDDLGSLWVDSDDNKFYILTAITPTWTNISIALFLELLAVDRSFLAKLNVVSDFSVNTNKFNVAAATGNTLVAGTLGITGIATLAKASLLASTDAPTTDAMLVPKKYVDDKIKNTVVQIVNTKTGAVAAGSIAIPYDDTIPQINEGTEFMTLAITPTSASNKLKVEVVFQYSGSDNGPPAIAALFQDTTADALAVAFNSYGLNHGGTNYGSLVFTFYMTAGTTSATTFRVRAGFSNTQQITFNGDAGARKFGGVMASSITITEISV